MKYQTITFFLRTKYPDIFNEYHDHLKQVKSEKNKVYRQTKKQKQQCLIVDSEDEKEDGKTQSINPSICKNSFRLLYKSNNTC